jgi:signal peptidase II
VDRPARRAALLFGTALVVYALDRLTKLWAEDVLVEHPIEVIRGVLTLRFASNSGGAFSLGTSAPWFFATATIVVSALIAVTAFRARPPLQAAALGLILGGALGNLTDRMVRGSALFAFDGRVVDWVDVHLWPVFNVADSAVVVGAILLGWTSFREAQRHARTGEEPTGSVDV